MRWITILIFLSTSANAQEKPKLDELIKVLDNPSKALNDPQCAEKNNTVANSCVSLSGAVCAIRNPQIGLSALRSRAANYPTIPFNNSNLPTLEGIAQVERDVFETSLVKQEDLASLFSEVRTSMLSMISQNVDLTPAQKGKMKEKIETVQFMSGSEYVRHRETNLNPNETPELAQLKGLRNYSENCGNGTQVSAFNQLDKVVLCPGLIQSLMDFSPRSKREMLNSLAFTLGHELAHSIDSTEARFPEPYERMRTCYNQLQGGTGQFETRGPEITADFWGAQILSERLRADDITGSEAIRALALATDEFCSFHEDKVYPSGRARLDLTIGRDPQVRQALGCGAPTNEAPVCTIAGTIPGSTPPNVATSK